MKKGKLIVIEGSDGSGKSTQLNLLKEYFANQKIKHKTHKFPQYETSFYGKMIGNFLRGEYGDLKTVDPHLISVVYAADRGEAKEMLNEWLDAGNMIVMDRYATSSAAHQCGRIPKKNREDFLAWLEEMEYKTNKIPREDVVIYLHVPYKKSIELMSNEDRNNRKYTQGKKVDIVEENMEYLKKSQEVYEYLAAKYPHWERIDCVDSNGNLRTREDIHEEIRGVLKKKKIL